jgi:hypothetical protein
MSVSVPNTFTANTKIQSAQVNANFTAVLALTPITTLGDLVYASSSTATARLAGNTTTTRKFLSQTGDGVNSAAPAWNQPRFSDLTTTALGDLPYGGVAGAGTVLSGNTTSSINFLGQTGTGAASAAPAWTAFTAPTVQTFTSTGTQSGWLFTITAGNATVGATYTNNSNTYTVLYTIAGSTTLACSGTGATSGGTLTKATGSGDASITFSAKVALATYTTPTSPRTPLYIRVRAAAGGGGGGGSGTTSSLTNGGTGGQSFFGGAILNGGAGAVDTGSGGAGGSATLPSGFSGFAIIGNCGGGPSSQNTASTQFAGGLGGASTLFGGGVTSSYGGGSQAGTANTGSGGSGAGCGTTAGSNSGTGGGAGGQIDTLVAAPAASYAYVIGAGGTAGSAGTNGFAGQAGGSGFIIVEEFYQ